MNNPPFSIILPVRNGGSYIKLCVESILTQTFSDFDLIILENFSTDGTHEFLLSLADSRIKIFPSSIPLSIEENWQRIREIPKNEFMTIIGHDDILDANYLEVMDNLIRENPNAGLYQTHFRLIDAEGEFIRNCLPMPKQETAAEFLAARLALIRDSFGTGYMMRSQDYDKLGGIPAYPKLLFADDALWLGLMELSWKATAHKECFAYRLHSGSTSGTPDQNSYFNALEQYVLFLENLSLKDRNIAHIVRKYAPKLMRELCQGFYKLVREQAHCENRVPSRDEIQRINTLLKKSYCDFSLDINDGYNFNLMEWVYHTPLKKYAHHLSYMRYPFNGNLIDKIIVVCYLFAKLVRHKLRQAFM